MKKLILVLLAMLWCTPASAQTVAQGAPGVDPWLFICVSGCSGGAGGGLTDAELRATPVDVNLASSGVTLPVINSSPFTTSILDSLTFDSVRARVAAPLAGDAGLVTRNIPSGTQDVGASITTQTGTITSNANPNDRVTLTCSGVCASASMEFVATGGPTGTLVFEVSTSGGSTYYPLEGVNTSRGGSSPIAASVDFDVSVTTSGLWRFPLPVNTTNVRVRANSWGSGSWAINLYASSLPAQVTQLSGMALVSAPSGPANQATISNRALYTSLMSPQNGSAQADVITQTDAAVQPNYVPYHWTLPMWYNGATWDRARGTIANGGLVDVSRVQGTVTVAGTVVQGNAGTNAQAWWARIGDSTTGPVAVKGATTPPSASDKSLVVSLSPNSATPDPTPVQDSLFWDTTSPGGSSQSFNVAGYGTFTFFMQATSATGGVITITGSQTGNAVTLPIYEITSTGPVARTSLDISVLGTAERMYMIPVLGVEHIFFTLTSVITGGGAFVVVSTEANVAVWPEPLSSQGFKGTLTQSWWQQISDGTTGPVAVKAASTAAAATDKAMVVAVSPNNSVAVTGPLTDAQLRASAVPISAASLPLPAGAATDATLTGGTAKAIMRGGAKGATAAADVTSTAEGADHQAVDVQNYHGGAAIDPRSIRTLTSADVVDVSDRSARTLGVVSTKTALTANAPATGSIGVASAALVASNGSRKGLVVVNVSNATCSLAVGATAVLNSGITLQAGAVWNMNEYSFATGAVNAICSAAASTLSVQEFQ